MFEGAVGDLIAVELTHVAKTSKENSMLEKEGGVWEILSRSLA